MPSFDPERHARPLSIAGTVAVVAGLYSGADIGWAAAAVGVALLLTACYSRRDGFLMFGPFARADAVRAARSRRTHLVRAGIALAAGAVIFEGSFDAHSYSGGNLNRNAFRARVEVAGKLAVGIGLLVPFLTVLLVSGAIAEERAAKRWEVLLTTDLRGRELVFGKLLGKLWLVVEPVVVILPVLAMLPLIVGLSPEVMLLFGGFVFVSMLALAGLSALASVVTKSRVGVAGAVVAFAFGYLSFSPVLLIWTATTPDVGTFPRSLGFESPVVLDDLVEAFNMANPVTTLVINFDRATAGPPMAGYVAALRQYSAGALGVFLVGTLLACHRVRTLRDPGQVKGFASLPIRIFGRGKSRVSLQELRANLRPPVTDDPLAWWANCRLGVSRTGPTRWRSVALAFAVCTALLLTVHAVEFVGRFTLYPWLQQIGLRSHVGVVTKSMREVLMLALPGTCVVALIVPVISAAQSVAKERSGDTLDSLRLTPLTAREMLAQIHAGCSRTNRTILWHWWAVPTAAAVVTGFFPPHLALALALLTSILASPLVSVALYCSVWASTPARAMRNLIFGGAVGHYLLMGAGAVVFLGLPIVLDFEEAAERLRSNLIEPDEFVHLKYRLRRDTLPMPVRYPLSLVTYGAAVAIYWIIGLWVFERAVGRFAKSRNATA